MTFRGSRLRALRTIKGIRQQGELARLLGVRQSVLSEWEGGTAEPDLARLAQLATLLDCTTDYLLGRTWNEMDDVRLAASRMAYEVFAAGIAVSDESRERCFRVVGHEAAPVTAEGWRHLAEQISLALGPWKGTQIKKVGA